MTILDGIIASVGADRRRTVSGDLSTLASILKLLAPGGRIAAILFRIRTGRVAIGTASLEAGQMSGIVALRGPASSGGIAAPRAPLRLPDDAPIAVEISTLAACAGLRAEWADLAARALVPNLFFGPDFALAAAQHLVAFRDTAVLLAWQGGVECPRRRLVGLLLCPPRDRFFTPEALHGVRDARIFDGAPLLDAALAEPALVAMLTRRRRLAGCGLDLRAIDLASALLPVVLHVAERLDLSATLRPAPATPRCRLGAASLAKAEALRVALAGQGRLELAETGTGAGFRDAVELVLALDASGAKARAGRAILQDTREAGFLRAMTRGLSRTRQCRTALLRLEGRPIAGAILLGKGASRWVYLTAADEALAGYEPDLVLLAMLRRANPRCALRLATGASLLGGAEPAFGSLQLAPRAALQPRDLALKLRDSLARSVFSPARAGSAG